MRSSVDVSIAVVAAAAHVGGDAWARVTMRALDAWLDAEQVWIDTVKGTRGNWVVDLLTPRQRLVARGLGDSWLEALRRAVVNLDSGVVP